MECCSICYDVLHKNNEDNDPLSENETQSSHERWNGCLTHPKLQFCNECIFQYLQASIFESKLNSDGKVGCPCPEKCGAFFTDEEVHRYITNTFDYEKYLLFSKRRQVESNPNCIFCPNQNCGNQRMGGTVIFIDQSKSFLQLKCKECKINVCSKCHASHSPLVSCERALGNGFNQWKRSTPSGCKPCPECRFYIEKNEGCNHMTCSRCGHQFCWLCLSRWSSGCTSPKRCKLIAAWTADLWGTGPIQRGLTRSFAFIAAAPAAGLAVGLAATGAGCLAAFGALTVPAVTVTALVRTIQQGIYVIHKQTYPIIIHLPWNRRVLWCHAIDGETEAGSFLGFEGRHHPCGIFVSKAKISSNSLDTPGWKSWLKYGPNRLQGNITLVMYFVPNGTTRVTLKKMLPDYESYPTTAYPASSYEIESSQIDSVRLRFDNRVLTAIDDFIARGSVNPIRGNNHRGLMSDPEDYGLPEPCDDRIDSAFTSDIVRCSHCTQSKYFTNSILYQTHMANEHADIYARELQDHDSLTLALSSNLDLAILD